MNFIDEIKSPILDEMHLFEKVFAEDLDTDNQLLLQIIEYVRETSGKQLRPILTILSAKVCGMVTEDTVQCAKSVEMLHTASLIHDDIVDDTLERRGNASINSRWTNKIAVFAGDYMFSKSLSCANKTNNIAILKSISEIGSQLTDGELLQLVQTQLSKTTEDNYYTIIRKKTAQLFASCCEVGALSVGATKDELAYLRNFGLFLGISFQIKDDIFDYFENIKIGKPTGNDIRDGKVTLPLIYALQHASDDERKIIANWIDNRDYSSDNIQTITRFAREMGGVDYAIEQMEVYKNKAIEELNSFEDSDMKKSLVLCAEYAASRKF